MELGEAPKHQKQASKWSYAQFTTEPPPENAKKKEAKRLRAEARNMVENLKAGGLVSEQPSEFKETHQHFNFGPNPGMG